jgi:hypothetical protein
LVGQSFWRDERRDERNDESSTTTTMEVRSACVQCSAVSARSYGLYFVPMPIYMMMPAT